MCMLAMRTGDIMYLSGIINTIGLSVDFANQNANTGDSIWPFVSFMMFFVGIMGAFMGFVIVNAARMEWHVFYATNDKSKEVDKAGKKKNIIKGCILFVVSVSIFGASFFVK